MIKVDHYRWGSEGVERLSYLLRSRRETGKEVREEDRLPASWSIARPITTRPGRNCFSPLVGIPLRANFSPLDSQNGEEHLTWSLVAGVVCRADCENYQRAVIFPFLLGCYCPEREREREPQSRLEEPACNTSTQGCQYLGFTDTQIQRQ